MIDTAWVLLSLSLFVVICFLIDRLSPAVKEIEIEEETPSSESPKEEPISARPLFKTDGEAFLKSLEEETTNIPQTDELEEVYPERLNKLRTWEGFQSNAFENLWRKSTGNVLRI